MATIATMINKDVKKIACVVNIIIVLEKAVFEW